jgi:general secretion pathway protein H
VRRIASTDGFTLAEMLVVLALIALLAGASFPLVNRSRDLKREAQLIAAMLKSARLHAISGNVEATFEADMQKKAIVASGASEQLELSATTKVTMTTAREEVEFNRGIIRFFPDGTSTGGKLTLMNEHGAIAIEVHWLTGRIHLDAIRPE